MNVLGPHDTITAIARCVPDANAILALRLTPKKSGNKLLGTKYAGRAVIRATDYDR